MSDKQEATSSDEEEDEPAAPNGALLQQLLGGAAGGGSDSDSDDDEVQPPETRTTAASQSTAAEAPADEGGLLPSATSLLFDGGGLKPDFLRVAGPDFDASANFKPPPVTHSDLTGTNLGGDHLPRRTLNDDAPGQRHHQEEQFGRGEGQVRMRGSVCHETDSERGRRVLYGAHSMLQADPWSACNPNRELKSHASGKKRRNGET